MVVQIRRLLAGRPARLLLGGLGLLLVGTALAPWISSRSSPGSLLDRARQGTWQAPPATDPPASPAGYQEIDVVYANGQYYLFSTGSQDPAWVNVYVGRTPEELVQSAPVFTQVAPIRYPTVVKDGDTWHMWGVNPPKKWTEHWVSHNADPTGFVYADSPFREVRDPPVIDISKSPVVDFAVRRNPVDHYWYGVGFETQENAPLLLTRAASPNGPWERLNYVPQSREGGIFGDTGTPPWATSARPDPNLAFTADGRAWVFFTGRPKTQQPPLLRYRAGMVEVDVTTGKAIGNPVVLFDPQEQADFPSDLASDLVLVSAPGQPDRIFGYTHNPLYPLGQLDVPDSGPPGDGRTGVELVRLDTGRGFDVAAGIAPVRPRYPVRWNAPGLDVSTNYGGVGSYLAAATLNDLTFQVDFTPARINAAALNTVAFIGGPNYDAGAALSVQIDATGAVPTIIATLRGADGSPVVLNSGMPAAEGTDYSVVVRRADSRLALEVNGTVRAERLYDVPLTGLEAWSLAGEATLTQQARYPFQGAIRSFVVTSSGR
jgi:hypothetical protein